MPRPIRFISLLLFLTFSLLLLACGKEETAPTVINGKVTDKKTGAPIQGAAIDIDFRTEKTVSGSIKTEHEYISLSTDQQGEFHYTYNADYTSYFSEIRVEGYAPKTGIKIIRGNVNNLEIKLAPIDGILCLELSNETGLNDSIYVIIENPSFIYGGGSLGQIYLNNFPVILAHGGKYVECYDLPSEEFTKIHWGYNYFASFKSSSFRDSVFLNLHDTTLYKLTY